MASRHQDQEFWSWFWFWSSLVSKSLVLVSHSALLVWSWPCQLGIWHVYCLVLLNVEMQAHANLGLVCGMYGCESWTLKAADSKRLNAFKMDMYRRMMRISWREHRTNNSIIEELQPTCHFLAEVKRRKLQYFGHVKTRKLSKADKPVH